MGFFFPPFEILTWLKAILVTQLLKTSHRVRVEDVQGLGQNNFYSNWRHDKVSPVADFIRGAWSEVLLTLTWVSFIFDGTDLVIVVSCGKCIFQKLVFSGLYSPCTKLEGNTGKISSVTGFGSYWLFIQNCTIAVLSEMLFL